MINKVLITGVAGFIGSNLLDFLIDKTDWKIDGIDNFSTGNISNVSHHLQNKRFTFSERKCSDLTAVKQYDCIFHLAALPRIQPSFEYVKEHINANLIEAMHLVELMIADDHFPKLVYSSSSAIYGTPLNIPTDETERIDCLSPYAFQKYEVEKYLELLSTRYPLNYVNLRYFNPFGPRSFNPANKFNAYSSVVGIFINRKKQGLPLLVTGDGSQRRDFVHVRDVANANYLAAIHGEKINTSINIGSGSAISIIDLAKMISEKIEFIPKRDGEADLTFANIKKAGMILNWSAEWSLKEYIKNESLREE